MLWNALAFNQWITGCFGSRQTTAHGYGVYQMEECVWCCVHNGGLAFTEYARQAVTWRDGAIHVNLLVPGTYRLEMPGGTETEVKISTTFPATADALLDLPDRPLPDWTFVDEGPGGKCWVPGAAANVDVRFPNDEERTLRFVPQCYFTSCLALHDTPVVFNAVEL